VSLIIRGGVGVGVIIIMMGRGLVGRGLSGIEVVVAEAEAEVAEEEEERAVEPVSRVSGKSLQGQWTGLPRRILQLLPYSSQGNPSLSHSPFFCKQTNRLPA